jgi:hypothetical protein
MKKYTKVTNEFIELVRDSRRAVIEDGVGFAFNKTQVSEISKYLNRYFAKSAIIVSEEDGIYSISLHNSIIPIAKQIVEKARLLKQFCLNNEKNREKLCLATKSSQLDRIYHDIIINW